MGKAGFGQAAAVDSWIRSLDELAGGRVTVEKRTFIPIQLTGILYRSADYLSLALIVHERGKTSGSCNGHRFSLVKQLWKVVDKLVIVTLPNSRVVVLSTNPQP